MKSVNGSVSIGEQARVSQEVNTVNGAVSLGKGARVAGGVDAVNGAMELAQGAEVLGGLRNVNGLIHLEAARVGRGGSQKVPRVIVGPGAIVEGTLRFDREVKLYVSERAQIGPVEGAVPEGFGGDWPKN